MRVLVPAGFDADRRAAPGPVAAPRRHGRRDLVDRSGQRRGAHRRARPRRGDARRRPRRLVLRLAQRRERRGRPPVGDPPPPRAAARGSRHRYGTRTDRGGRAIAGLSMGGFGALLLRRPPPRAVRLRRRVLRGASTSWTRASARPPTSRPPSMGAAAGDIWGRWPAHRTNRRAHNPLDLAENLATLRARAAHRQRRARRTPRRRRTRSRPGSTARWCACTSGSTSSASITCGTTTARAPTTGPTGPTTSPRRCRR